VALHAAAAPGGTAPGGTPAEGRAAEGAAAECAAAGRTAAGAAGAARTAGFRGSFRLDIAKIQTKAAGEGKPPGDRALDWT